MCVFKALIAKEANVDADCILGSDLYLYNRNQPSIWGANEEFVSCAQLDDLQCAFSSLQGFLKGSHKNSINVFACFDNEEVGSTTRQGANSTFLEDILNRISLALNKSKEEHYRNKSRNILRKRSTQKNNYRKERSRNRRSRNGTRRDGNRRTRNGNRKKRNSTIIVGL